MFSQARGYCLAFSDPVLGAKGIGEAAVELSLPAPTAWTTGSGGPGATPPSSPPSSWFCPRAFPHPTCVSTIFALYNRPLYTINPHLHIVALCAWRGGSDHGSCHQGSLAFCLPESVPVSDWELVFVIFLPGEWRIEPSHPRLGPLGSGHPEIESTQER